MPDKLASARPSQYIDCLASTENIPKPYVDTLTPRINRGSHIGRPPIAIHFAHDSVVGTYSLS